VPPAELLGENFARLELGSGAMGTEKAQTAAFELISNPDRQGELRANNGEVDTKIRRSFGYRGKVVCGDRKEVGSLGDPRISRSGEDLTHTSGPAQRVDQGVLTGAGSEYEDPHQLSLRLQKTQQARIHDVFDRATSAEIVRRFCEPLHERTERTRAT